MKIISIHNGHNASAAYFEDGSIKDCISEERFTKIKNQGGLPAMAVNFILNKNNLKSNDLDLFVICGNHANQQFYGTNQSGHVSLVGKLKIILLRLESRVIILEPVFSLLRRFFGYRARYKISSQQMDGAIAEKFSLDPLKIKRFDHHTLHAATVYYGLCDLEEEWLVITVDGGGDENSSSVFVSKNNRLERIAATPVDYSLGCFYSAVTEYLGMKPLEHEYKVMGLAPYADEKLAKEVKKIFKELIWFESDTLQFKSKIKNPLYLDYLKEKLFKKRFDAIALAAQRHVENLLCQLVTASIQRTNIRNVSVAGGVFMNIKANLAISSLPEVDKLVIFPSCGDESLPMGGCFVGAIDQGYRPENIAKIKDLYLGGQVSSNDLIPAIEKLKNNANLEISEPQNIEIRVAELLAVNKIVAVFQGRSEWGARALGHRSILANPKNTENIKIINEQIKNRDFWMPFAASILKERAGDYLKNPKNVSAPYMVMSFPTTELAEKEIKAALHPYDLTCRPQLVDQDFSPNYYKILKHFEQLTGIGGVLNTSFNLHGEPLVETVEDAIRTFINSGLQFLVLENYLIAKK